jgi:hypothetical protein
VHIYGPDPISGVVLAWAEHDNGTGFVSIAVAFIDVPFIVIVILLAKQDVTLDK